MWMAAEVGDAVPRPVVIVRHSVDALKVRHILSSRCVLRANVLALSCERT